MTDSRISKLAKVLVTYSTAIKEKEKVLITGSTHSEPLLKEIFREVVKAGANAYVRMLFPDQEYILYKYAKDHQLDYPDPFGQYEVENIDARILTFPDLNTHALTSIDSSKKQRKVAANKKYMDAFYGRVGEGSLRWVGTACPTVALAQEAKMSFEEYSEFLFEACKLNMDDPIAYWKAFSKKQQKICDYLNTTKTIRYVGQDTDLSFGVEGRRWINCDGRINFPDGEVFTGPVENSVEGAIRFTYPGVYLGEEIEDIFLRFEKGKVVEAKAKKGHDLLQKVLSIDEGAKYVGEVAIGTNYQINRFTKNMLFDEKMGGTIHVAIGRGFTESGSSNVSAIHWDMLKDMKDGGEIYADGKLIYKNGNFINSDFKI